MPGIGEIRALYPGQTRDKSDLDIANDFARANRISPESAALHLGVELPNAPGAVTAFKNALGSQVQGVGQVATDLGWENNPVDRYGRDVQQRNPIDINSLSDIADRPWGAVKQGTGMALGYMLPGLIGRGAQFAGVAAGLPRLVAAGDLANSFLAQSTLAGLPAYGQIRQQQVQDGHADTQDKWLAALGAAVTGASENLFGVQRALGIGRGANTALTGAASVAEHFAPTPFRTAVREGRKVIGEEMGEELFQNPVQQLTGYQDPTDVSNIDQTLTGAAMAGLGTLGMGAITGAHMGMRHAGVNNFIDQHLADTSGPMMPQLQAAEWQREMMVQPQGRPAAEGWYSNYMASQNAQRLQDFATEQAQARAATQAQAAANPVDLLTLGRAPAWMSQFAEAPAAPQAFDDWAGIQPPADAATHQQRAEDVLAAFNTPSGDYIGGRPLTQWESLQRAQGVPQSGLQPGLAKLPQDFATEQAQARAATQAQAAAKTAPAAAAPAAAPSFGDLFIQAGGRDYKFRNELNNAQSVPDVLDLLRTKADATNSDKTFAALDAMHWAMTQQTLSDWKSAQEKSDAIAPMDAARGPGPGADTAGSAGLAPVRDVKPAGRSRVAAGAVPGGGAGVAVGTPNGQQIVDLTNRGTQNGQAISPSQDQGAPGASQPEAAPAQPGPGGTPGRGSAVQEGGQREEGLLTDDQHLAAGHVRVTRPDGSMTWVVPQEKAKGAARVSRTTDVETVPYQDIQDETDRALVADYMGLNEDGERDEEVPQLTLRELGEKHGMSHMAASNRLASLGYTDAYRKSQEETPQEYVKLGDQAAEDTSPQTSDDAVDINDLVEGNLRVQKGVGSKGRIDSGKGWETLLNRGTRFDARTKNRMVWSEGQIAEAVASGTMPVERMREAVAEIDRRAKLDAAHRNAGYEAIHPDMEGGGSDLAPRRAEAIAASEGSVTATRARQEQDTADRQVAVSAAMRATERRKQIALEREKTVAEARAAVLLTHPEASAAESDWNTMRAPGTPAFVELSNLDKAGWVSQYLTILNDDEVSGATQTGEIAKAQRFYEQEIDNASEHPAPAEAQRAGDEGRGSVPGGGEEGEGSRGRADASAEVSDTPANPFEERIASLRQHAGERQGARIDKLIKRYQSGDIDAQRFADELQSLEDQAFPPDKGGHGVQYSVAPTARGMTREAVEQTIAPVVAKWAHGTVTVVQSESELPHDARPLNSLSREATQAARHLSDQLVAAARSSTSRSTQAHQVDVAALATMLAKELHLSSTFQVDLAQAGLVHDIGKSEIPDSVLLADRQLTPDEFALVKHHPEAGAEMLRRQGVPQRILDLVAGHHRQSGGKGYPASSEYLSFREKILRAADVACSVGTHDPGHPYVHDWGVAKALRVLSDGSFDPEVVAAFKRLADAGHLPSAFGRGAVEGAYLGNGRIYLVADSLKSPRRVLEVLAHEAVGHLVMEELTDPGTYNRAVGSVAALEKARPDWKSLARKIDLRQPGLDATTRAKEIIALSTEDGSYKNVPVIRRMVDAITAGVKSALRAMGFRGAWVDSMTSGEIFRMLRQGEARLTGDGSSRTGALSPMYSYAGLNAATADKSNLRVAMNLHERLRWGDPTLEGLSIRDGNDVRSDTGWFKGADGKWRFEIDDSKAKFKKDFNGLQDYSDRRPVDYPLQEVLDHPELFAAYPELKGLTFTKKDAPGDSLFRNVQGWQSDSGVFVTPYAADPKGSLLHEIQHWIQEKEGFAPGGRPESVQLNNQDALDRARKYVESPAWENPQERQIVLDKIRRIQARKGTFDELYEERDALVKQSDDLIDKLREVEKRIEDEANRMDASLRNDQAYQDLMRRVEALMDAFNQTPSGTPAKEALLAQIRALSQQDPVHKLVESRRQKLAAPVKDALDKIEAAVGLYNQNLQRLGDPDVSFVLYHLIAGEREARDTANRQNMTLSERRSIPPNRHEGIADSLVTALPSGARTSSAAMYSRSAPEAAMPAAPADTPEGFLGALHNTASDAAANPIGAFKRFGLGALTMEQMADVVKSSAVRHYNDVLVAIQKFSKDRIAEASKLDIKWAALPDRESINLSDVMRTARRLGFDPAEEHATHDADQTALQARFDALHPDAKALYVAVRDFYAKNFNDQKAILLDAAAQAKAAGKNVNFIERMFAKVQGPYFPLARLGDWYSVGMSPEMAELMQKKEDGSASAQELKRIETMRKDAHHYVTSGHTTRGEAQRSARELQARLGVGYSNIGRERTGMDRAAMPDLATLESYIAADLPVEVRQQVKDMVTQMYFDMLPARSDLKHRMKSENIHGEEEDMRRVFAATAQSSAHHISRLKYANDLSAAMLAVDEESRGGNETMSMVRNELKKRAALAMSYERNPVIDRLMQMSYFTHLGLSPAFILTSLSQVPMITIPWLGARHGFGRASAALAKSYGDIFSLLRSTYSGKDGWRSEFDWSSRFRPGSPEDKMFHELLKRNLLDIPMEYDLTAVAEMRNGKFDDVLRMANLPVRLTELANRAVTGLAAYRLAVADRMDHAQAVEQAAKAVSETQLNYSGLNAARHMQSVLGSKALARLMMQFRQYQQGMLYLVGKNAYDALKGGTAKERSIARRTLFGLFTTTGLMAGALGLPAAGTAMSLVSMIGGAFGPPDEPFDAEVEFRNWLTDALGPDMAAVLAKGLPTLLSIDGSNRFGLGDVASPLPFMKQGKTGTEKVNNAIAAAFGGAAMDSVGSILDGITKLAGGDYLKGAEKVVPIKLAQNLIRGYRYSEDGLTNSKGELVVPAEKFTPWDRALRSVGFQPMRESEYYSANNAVENAREAASATRGSLLRQYAQGVLKGEPAGDLEGSIADFNARHPEKGLRIDASSRLKAVQARRKMAHERNEVGVRIDKGRIPFESVGRFAAP